MKKILLVEDNETIVFGLKYSLDQEGFSVETAKNIIMAKAQIKKQKFDLCLLDISLPDGDGYELCEYIKKNENNEADTVSFTIKTDESVDIREKLFYMLAEAKIPVLKMQANRISLEDIFLELTQNEKEEKSHESDI